MFSVHLLLVCFSIWSSIDKRHVPGDDTHTYPRLFQLEQLKGTVAQYFWPQFFFMNQPHMDSRIRKWFRGVSYPAVVCTCRRFSKSVPLKWLANSHNFFRLILRGLNLPVGSETPQNKILRGIRPCRTRFCGVSDPAEPSLAGYQTPQNNDRHVYIYSRCLFCVVWYSAEQRPAGPDTLPNKVLRGIRPRGTKFCGELHPREQL